MSRETTNKGAPHLTFMRRDQNADTHAHKQHLLSQNNYPVGSSFVLVIASDTHLESKSEKRGGGGGGGEPKTHT